MSQYKQKTEYYKQEYERESQKTDEIKQKNDKLVREYQKSLNALKKPINVQYEKETKTVGGLFNKETQETGNVVIRQEDFNAFQKQIEAAQSITDDYEYIKSDKALNDLKSENNELKQENENLRNDKSELICLVAWMLLAHRDPSIDNERIFVFKNSHTTQYPISSYVLLQFRF